MCIRDRDYSGELLVLEPGDELVLEVGSGVLEVGVFEKVGGANGTCGTCGSLAAIEHCHYVFVLLSLYGLFFYFFGELLNFGTEINNFTYFIITSFCCLKRPSTLLLTPHFLRRFGTFILF
eukprot:TRINITY_DN1655_c0_g4_i1.p1 TRINITY_DN1655_c0_g4~~TRINITY_DN1655_c0_g4_i1.p1  ORF type:complete len:136 (-),score=12.60 TRINITY_DN1655_c0_g4_i1:446-808(-)